jgi:CheY-like chemotaxis protein
VSQSKPSAAPEPDGRRVTVLVVEDEVLIRIDVADCLRDEGLRVLEASSADEALRLLEQGHSVDVIFSDIHMPGRIDGLDLHAIVAREFPRVKVILTSATSLPERKSTPETPFIPKPYLIGTVLRAVEDELGKDDA